jgi:hypothetical protein
LIRLYRWLKGFERSEGVEIGFPVQEVCTTLKKSDGILVEEVIRLIRQIARGCYPVSNAVMTVTGIFVGGSAKT